MNKDVTDLSAPSFEEMRRVRLSVRERDSRLSALDRECIAFSRYLINERPSLYVVDKYRDAHLASDFLNRSKVKAMDRLLLNVGSRHTLLAKLVDSYTSLFFKTSAIRKKWILLLAILESCAPTYEYFDSPERSNRGLVVIRMIGNLLGFAVILLLSVALFLPLHMLLSLYSVLSDRTR